MPFWPRAVFHLRQGFGNIRRREPVRSTVAEDALYVFEQHDAGCLFIADTAKLVGERRPFLEELLQAKCAQYSEVSATIASLEKGIDRLTEMLADLNRKRYEAERMDDFDGAMLLLKRDRDLDARRRNLIHKTSEIGGPYYDCMEQSLVSLQSQAQGYTELKLDFWWASDEVVIQNSNEIPIPHSKPTKPESPE